MDRNTLNITSVTISKDTVTCQFTVTGPWSGCFLPAHTFKATYSEDIGDVPPGVAVVPFLCNILPVSWIFDAAIYMDDCDGDFYNSIAAFKQGYINMYPMITFGGVLEPRTLSDNRREGQSGSAAFFSGGVDAFFTLIRHLDERPRLITIWGADIRLDDQSGWEKVRAHTERTSAQFGLEYVTIKSNFNEFLDKPLLSRAVTAGGDGWWHGFQHGIGIIGHAAPYLHASNLSTVYIASSLSPVDKNVVIASYPTIDNHVRFCGCNVVHDGFEAARQDKVGGICAYSRENDTPIPMRVCWESSGGNNCCACEKCARTMLAILAEGYDPNLFGFTYDEKVLARIKRLIMYKEIIKPRHYLPIQKRMSETYTSPGELARWAWFTERSADEMNATLPKRIRRSGLWQLLRKLKHKIIR